MGDLLTLELEQKALATREALQSAVRQYGKVVYSNSLGAEAMVLTDIIWSHVPEIDIFSIDTGRLHEETYELLEKLERRYKKRITLVYPDSESLAKLVDKQGVNAFFHSLDARLACCHVRKVEPFKRAIQGYGAWITGVRRPAVHDACPGDAGGVGRPRTASIRSARCSTGPKSRYGSTSRPARFPYNVLHDRAFPSIGCSPCTPRYPAG
ncbi:MAG: phosphoadenosine phosphosulfate reductase family protein [Gammaproteobacteria bacterium]